MTTDITNMSIEFQYEFDVKYKDKYVCIRELWASHTIDDVLDSPEFRWDELSAECDIFLGGAYCSSKKFQFGEGMHQELKELILEGLKDPMIAGIVNDKIVHELDDYATYLIEGGAL